jgi:hypothetical protein
MSRDKYYNNKNYNNGIYEFYVRFHGNWKYGYVKYSTILYSNDNNYSNDDGLCHCNPKNTELDKHLLCFSDLFTDCNLCLNYKIDDTEEHDDNEEDFNTDTEYDIIINVIKQNPEVIFMKNYLGLYPLDFIDLLYDVLQLKYNGNDNGKGTYYALSIQEYLGKIKKTIKYEYLKYDLCKSVAFRYIKNSNHIGNNGKRLQLPYELWEHIFTFI